MAEKNVQVCGRCEWHDGAPHNVIIETPDRTFSVILDPNLCPNCVKIVTGILKRAVAPRAKKAAEEAKTDACKPNRKCQRCGGGGADGCSVGMSRLPSGETDLRKIALMSILPCPLLCPRCVFEVLHLFRQAMEPLTLESAGEPLPVR